MSDYLIEREKLSADEFDSIMKGEDLAPIDDKAADGVQKSENNADTAEAVSHDGEAATQPENSEEKPVDGDKTNG